ncbi:MAG: S23 ribosomal [uncultured bacterium]|nr:MAG: S23 ribosomal [uncultured bacterium]
MIELRNNTMYSGNFEKLEVWQKSHQFVLSVYKITRSFPKEELYALTSQLRRSASSVPTNIVEGNEKRSIKEYIQFLYTAKSSLAEAKYHLLLAQDLEYINNITFNELLNNINEIGKMLNGLINYLTNKK